MMDAAWMSVERELDLWQSEGLTAHFWIRDDDAVLVTPALRTLEQFARHHRVRIGLGVIPGGLTADLAAFLTAPGSCFDPMCHGWRHVNHSGAGIPSEFGEARPRSQSLADLQRALEVFQQMFDGPAVFVPPFNKMARSLRPELERIGFAALSSAPDLWLQRLARLSARVSSLPGSPISGLLASRQLDTHLDPVDWSRGTACSMDRIAGTLLGELRLRRKRYIPPATPIGLLLHHLIHDDAIWAMADTLVSRLKGRDGVAFSDLPTILARRPIPNGEPVPARS